MIAYVLIAAIALLAFAFLIVFGPLLHDTAVRFAPALAPFSGTSRLRAMPSPPLC